MELFIIKFKMIDFSYIFIALPAFFLIQLSRIWLLGSKSIKKYFLNGPTGDSGIYFQIIQNYRKNGIDSPDKRLLLTNNLHYQPCLYEVIVGKFCSDEFLKTKSWIPINEIMICKIVPKFKIV
jgi:hypothetical protein